MKIDVTKEHINKGEKSFDMCPVALAIRSALHPKHIKVGVGSRTCTLGGISVSLPPDAAERVANYTRTGKMEPFSFRLDVSRVFRRIYYGANNDDDTELKSGATDGNT